MDTAATTPQYVDVGLNARLDRIPVVGRHVVWIAVLGLAYLIEIYDSTVFSYAAPSVRKDFGLSVEQIGLLTSVNFAGMFIGALLGGRLADRFGRKKILIISSIFYGLMSLGSAISPDFQVLFATRLLTGIALQANSGVLILYVAEMFPKLSRGRFFSVFAVIGNAAVPLTALAALAIAPTSVAGWRWLFVIGGGGVLVALFVGLILPESVRWLTNNGRSEQAEKLVTRIEAEALKRHSSLSEPEVERAAEPAGGMGELFKPMHRRRLIVASGGFFLYIFCAYGFFSWIPTILTDRGMPQSAALTFAFVVSFGNVVGPVLVFFVADRIERKTAVLSLATLAALSLVVFAFVTHPTASVVAALCAQVCIAALAVSFNTYIAEIFPTSVRGVGVGAAIGMGRIGGVLSGVIVAAMYTGFGFVVLYAILAIILVISGLVVSVFGAKTSRRSLEDIAPA